MRGVREEALSRAGQRAASEEAREGGGPAEQDAAGQQELTPEGISPGRREE